MKPLSLARAVTALYGLVSLGGGVTGFLTAGSKASLIAGGISGALLLVSAGLMPRKTGLALGMAQLVTVAVLFKFAPAAVQTLKPLAVGMSLGGLLVLGTTSRALRHRMTSVDG